MKTVNRTLLAAAALGLAMIVSSCQTATRDATSAVSCDKCKTVWVQRPVQVGPGGKTSGYYALKSVQAMDCPDCESAVATFFKTGSLKHSCSHCGGAMNHCTGH